MLPEFEPTSFIKLMYDDKPVVNAGDVIYPHQAINPPHVWFPAPREDAHYTLVLVSELLDHIHVYMLTIILGGC